MSCSRRSILSILGTSLVWLSGCGDSNQSSAEDDGNPTSTGDSGAATPPADSDTTTEAADDAGESSSPGTWPMIEYSAGNTNTNSAVEGFTNKPRQRWRQPFAAANSSGFINLRDPLVANGYLTVEDGSNDVFAIDVQNGEVGLDNDSHGLPYEYRGSIPTIATDDGYYSVGFHRETDTRRFVAHGMGGDIRWEADIPAVQAVVAGETVFVTVSDEDQPISGVVALDRESGTEQWRQTAESGKQSFVGAAADQVFVARGKGFSAYGAVSGDRLWKFEMPDESRTAGLRFGRPRLSDKYVCVPGAGPATEDAIPRMWAFSHDDSSVQWTREGEVGLSPRVVSEAVIVGGAGQAIDLETGELQWSATAFVQELLDSGHGHQRIWDVVASENTIFFGTGDPQMSGDVPGTIGAVSTTDGEPRWEVTIEGGVRHLVLGGDSLFVVTHEGSVEAYASASSG